MAIVTPATPRMRIGQLQPCPPVCCTRDRTDDGNRPGAKRANRCHRGRARTRVQRHQDERTDDRTRCGDRRPGRAAAPHRRRSRPACHPISPRIDTSLIDNPDGASTQGRFVADVGSDGAARPTARSRTQTAPHGVCRSAPGHECLRRARTLVPPQHCGRSIRLSERSSIRFRGVAAQPRCGGFERRWPPLLPRTSATPPGWP